MQQQKNEKQFIIWGLLWKLSEDLVLVHIDQIILKMNLSSDFFTFFKKLFIQKTVSWQTTYFYDDPCFCLLEGSNKYSTYEPCGSGICWRS